ncbi:MAG: BMC domain-containing protein [Lachnospiraceae bacterium]|jgi:ethanolamine utilization protein EutS|nr:BMC domain-containing protein [Lachnospiraceae bacterium]
MNLNDLNMSGEQKMRIVQELVPGKQVTLAHIIASPDPIVYRKLGLDPQLDYQRAAIGILSMSPAEISVIAGDMAVKSANIDLGFIDRFSGTLIFTGRVAEVEAAIQVINRYLEEKLDFTICPVTRT